MGKLVNYVRRFAAVFAEYLEEYIRPELISLGISAIRPTEVTSDGGGKFSLKLEHSGMSVQTEINVCEPDGLTRVYAILRGI